MPLDQCLTAVSERNLPAKLLQVGLSKPRTLRASNITRGWLYTTDAELDPASDPQRVKSVIGRLRARSKKG